MVDKESIAGIITTLQPFVGAAAMQYAQNAAAAQEKPQQDNTVRDLHFGTELASRLPEGGEHTSTGPNYTAHTLDGLTCYTVDRPGLAGMQVLHPDNPYYDLRISADGRAVESDKANKSEMSYHLTEKGPYFDASGYRPSQPRVKSFGAGPSGAVNLRIETNGHISVESTTGTVTPNSVFVKCANGSLRTVNAKGELELPQMKDLPKDMPEEDRQAHKAFLKEVKKHGRQMDPQGAPPPPGPSKTAGVTKTLNTVTGVMGGVSQTLLMGGTLVGAGTAICNKFSSATSPPPPPSDPGNNGRQR